MNKKRKRKEKAIFDYYAVYATGLCVLLPNRVVLVCIMPISSCRHVAEGDVLSTAQPKAQKYCSTKVFPTCGYFDSIENTARQYIKEKCHHTFLESPFVSKRLLRVLFCWRCFFFLANYVFFFPFWQYCLWGLFDVFNGLNTLSLSFWARPFSFWVECMAHNQVFSFYLI